MREEMEQKDVYSISKKFLRQKIQDFWTEEVQVFQDIMIFHSELYYEKEAPIISDTQYDELFLKLGILEKQFFIKSRTTNRVGSIGKQSTFKKVPHARPMISLDNTYNEEELQDFETRILRILQQEQKLEYTVEFKFDGLWVELVYRWGNFIQAITRGNGIEGEDVTENVKQIQNIPQTLSYKKDIEIRWEVLMPLSSFEILNHQAKKTWEKIFSNPRNAASGSLRILDTSITRKRNLKFFAYDISNFTQYGEENYFDMVHSLEKLGFEISSYFKKCVGIQQVIQEVQSFWERKEKLGFEIDGLVIKVNTIAFWKNIGYTEHHPRYAIAYKFPAEVQTTTIESVEHSVWRTGSITPVANVSPINLWWAMIRRSTLHNYEEIAELEVKIGDTVFIKRAWEVIPKIISVVKEVRDGTEQEIEIPIDCPSCGETVQKDKDKVRYYCPNSLKCPAQIQEQLAYSVGRNGFDIEGLGEKQVEIFLQQWIIANLIDIFYLSEKREVILTLEWFQERSVDKLIESIEKVKKTDVTTFLKSIGIPWVGKKTARTLGKIFSSQEDIENFSYSYEELEKLNDIWPEIAKNVIDFFSLQKSFISDLLKILGITFEKQQKNISGKYLWKTLCVTGSFEWYTRDDLIKILEKEWGEFVSSVSKKTDYLLAGKKGGGKLEQAEKSWVEVLSLEEFL